MSRPLGHKSYGSIPHLPGSRVGVGDHSCPEGQKVICCENKRRTDTVIVQEKLDGSNVSVAKVNGQVLALGRAGYLAQTSPYEMHQLFAEWVRYRESKFLSLLREGERVCGEWLLQAHGTVYEPIPTEELFRPFDIIQGHAERLLTGEVTERVISVGLVPVTTLSIGPSVAVDCALDMLEKHEGTLRPTDGSQREGCVWRVEDAQEVLFLAKFVRHGKLDGQYLDGNPIWMGLNGKDIRC